MTTVSGNSTVKAGPWKQFLAVISHSGDSLVWLSLMIIVALLGEAHWRNWALTILVGMVAVGLLVKILKQIWRKQRPDGDWGGIYRRTDPYSFPSGHAARAAFLLTISLALGPLLLGVLLLVWAPLVCYSRVYLRLHVWFEVICGFVLGSVSALILAMLVTWNPIDFSGLFAS
ncbi:MAG: phosphatase PAP2 family protein [Gammaproteobacteria bacterium]